VEGPPPSPRTETPRSQRYSQRVSNQTKRNHDSISTSPIPLPQTTAIITCLSEPAPTNQLATLSPDQQAKRAWHTQDTLPGTRKRTGSQPVRQQHTPLTQILDTVALNSQILIQPNEQPTNSQPNKRTTRSQHISHNHVGVILFTACVIIFFFSIMIITSFVCVCVCVCSNCYIICVCLCVCHAGWNSPQALDSMSLPKASNLTSST